MEHVWLAKHCLFSAMTVIVRLSQWGAVEKFSAEEMIGKGMYLWVLEEIGEVWWSRNCLEGDPPSSSMSGREGEDQYSLLCKNHDCPVDWRHSPDFCGNRRDEGWLARLALCKEYSVVGNVSSDVDEEEEAGYLVMDRIGVSREIDHTAVEDIDCPIQSRCRLEFLA